MSYIPNVANSGPNGEVHLTRRGGNAEEAEGRGLAPSQLRACWRLFRSAARSFRARLPAKAIDLRCLRGPAARAACRGIGRRAAGEGSHLFRAGGGVAALRSG